MQHISTLILMMYLVVCSPVIYAKCTSAELEAKARVKIPLFQYGGALTGEAQNKYSSFQTLLTRKLTVLIRELQKDRADLDYLESLGIYLPEGKPLVDDLLTPAKRQEYWLGSRSLELLRGEITKTENYYIVLSDIYIGDLGAELGRKEIVISLPIVAELVPHTNDTHSLITYYLLAMDAKQLDCEMPLINHYMSKAWSVYLDLAKRENGIVGDLKLVEEELKKFYGKT